MENKKYISKETAIKECVAYILDTENDDFHRNPSDNHIYYYALIIADGRDEADKILKDALEE